MKGIRHPVEANLSKLNQRIVKSNMKYLSFADAYGLGLIAKNPNGSDWSEIVNHLSDDARQIAKEIIAPGSQHRNASRAAKELLDLAEKVRNDRPPV